MPPSLPVKPRPFRILALPLARLPRVSLPSSSSTSSPVHTVEAHSSSSPAPHDPVSPSSSTPNAPAGQEEKPKTPLLLFHVSQPDPSPSAGPPSLTSRALAKASDTWLKLGDKPKSSWMYWFYKRGEGLMDRIEYEEWSLKGIQEGRGVKIADKAKGEVQEKIDILLLKPNLRDQPLPPLLPKLHRMLIHRIPFHRKMMYRFLIFSPATWPFAIIPVVPNFPLFYVLWRAWSHYKAYRGALYLETLLKEGMIKESTDPKLDEVYIASGVVLPAKGEENRAPDATSSAKATSTSTSSAPDSAATTTNAKSLPPQAKGETPGAADSTSTPKAFIYSPSSSSSSTAAAPSSSAAGSASDSASSSRSASTGPNHASLLLRPNMVPLLTKAFDLRQVEVIDVNRAVEQADMRARKAEGEQQQSKEGAAEKAGTQWRGNLHR